MTMGDWLWVERPPPPMVNNWMDCSQEMLLDHLIKNVISQQAANKCKIQAVWKIKLPSWNETEQLGTMTLVLENIDEC